MHVSYKGRCRAQRKLIKGVELRATGVVGGVVSGQFGTCGSSVVPSPLIGTTTDDNAAAETHPAQTWLLPTFIPQHVSKEMFSTILFTRKISNRVYGYFDNLK